MNKSINEIIKIYNNITKNSIKNCLEYTDYLSSSEFENFLFKIPKMWEQRKKSCRSATIIPLIRILYNDKIPKELINSLISLDVKINTFDELLDKDSLKNFEKAAFVMSNLFSDLSIIEFAGNNEIIDNYKKYLTDIVTIPYIEKRTYKKILETEKSKEGIYEAFKSYKYRSKDISIFIELPNINLNLNINQKLKKQIYTYRMLELLSKDLLDLEDDIENNETKPTTAYVKKYRDKNIVIKKINLIKKRISYNVEWSNTNSKIEEYFSNLRNELGGIQNERI